jgi:hypothetical protein
MIRFLDRLRPAAHVVPQFIGSKVVGVEPPTCFQTDDAQTGAGERKCSDAADGTKADNDDVGLRQVRRHSNIS